MPPTCQAWSPLKQLLEQHDSESLEPRHFRHSRCYSKKKTEMRALNGDTPRIQWKRIQISRHGHSTSVLECSAGWGRGLWDLSVPLLDGLEHSLAAVCTRDGQHASNQGGLESVRSHHRGLVNACRSLRQRSGAVRRSIRVRVGFGVRTKQPSEEPPMFLF